MDPSIAGFGKAWAAYHVPVPASPLDFPALRLAHDAEAYATTRRIFAQLLIWGLCLGLRSIHGTCVDFGFVELIGPAAHVCLHRADLDRFHIDVVGSC